MAPMCRWRSRPQHQQEAPLISRRINQVRNSAFERLTRHVRDFANFVKLRQMVTIQPKKSESCLPISVRRDVRYFPAGGGSWTFLLKSYFQPSGSRAQSQPLRFPCAAIGPIFAFVDAVSIILASFAGAGGYQLLIFGTAWNLDFHIGAGMVTALLYLPIGKSFDRFWTQIRAFLIHHVGWVGGQHGWASLIPWILGSGHKLPGKLRIRTNLTSSRLVRNIGLQRFELHGFGASREGPRLG